MSFFLGNSSFGIYSCLHLSELRRNPLSNRFCPFLLAQTAQEMISILCFFFRSILPPTSSLDCLEPSCAVIIL